MDCPREERDKPWGVLMDQCAFVMPEALMRSSFFVTASVLSSMFIGMALISAIHASYAYDPSSAVAMGIIQN